MRRFILPIILLISPPSLAEIPSSWKAGAADVDITPDYPVRLSGYGGRTTEYEKVAQPIHAGALALQWQDDAPAVIVTVDNCGVPATVRTEVLKRVAAKGRPIADERFTLHSTHTHCAPMLKGVLPNRSPIRAAFNSSSYGWRIDPFNGNKAFHEGLDFSANAGAPIFAAAGGIVSAAETMPDYGKIVIVSHGSGLETRYAHTSKILVKVGERVEKGQVVALVGNTGRSTGPHLHYEIRLNGNALDPRKYLNARN